jgi:hypothetical protein
MHVGALQGKGFMSFPNAVASIVSEALMDNLKRMARHDFHAPATRATLEGSLSPEFQPLASWVYRKTPLKTLTDDLCLVCDLTSNTAPRRSFYAPVFAFTLDGPAAAALAAVARPLVSFLAWEGAAQLRSVVQILCGRTLKQPMDESGSTSSLSSGGLSDLSDGWAGLERDRYGWEVSLRPVPPPAPRRNGW